MKDNRIVIIAVCAVLLVAVIFYFSVRGEGPRYQWYEYYRATNDQPYGLSFIHKMLQSYSPDGGFTVDISCDRPCVRYDLFLGRVGGVSASVILPHVPSCDVHAVQGKEPYHSKYPARCKLVIGEFRAGTQPSAYFVYDVFFISDDTFSSLVVHEYYYSPVELCRDRCMVQRNCPLH